MFDNLVQIKTGEGKSITLAIVASIFALWGFEVSCACYSEYLSKRDYQAFSQLFEFFNIKE
jgi:preprotein translocase subunit SecA